MNIQNKKIQYTTKNTWFTSDNHFFHKNIIRYSDRPFSDIDDMTEKMIHKWNEYVQPNDIVWCLGDFGFARREKLEAVLRRLHGNKKLVLGNHDDDIDEDREFYLKNGLFSEIREAKTLRIEGQKLYLHHYAGRSWRDSHKGSWGLWGHHHGSFPPHGRSVDVGVDSTFITGKAEYRPFSFEEIRNFMNGREVFGHHERE